MDQRGSQDRSLTASLAAGDVGVADDLCDGELESVCELLVVLVRAQAVRTGQCTEKSEESKMALAAPVEEASNYQRGGIACRTERQSESICDVGVSQIGGFNPVYGAPRGLVIGRRPLRRRQLGTLPVKLNDTTESRHAECRFGFDSAHRKPF